MGVEHIGLSVPAPRSMAEWYCRHLGFRHIRGGGSDSEGVAFIVDDAGETVLEIFKLHDVDALPLRDLAPIQLHVAIDCKTPYDTAMALVQYGAEFVGEAPRNAYPGEKYLIRDPWGLVIQLLDRETKLEKSRGKPDAHNGE